MSALLYEILPVGPLQCNCSIVLDEATRRAVVIDPGDEPDRILAALARAGVTPVALLHTHAHLDHITGTRIVRRETSAPIRLHPADLPLYLGLKDQAAMFGFRAEDPLPVDAKLGDGDLIEFGQSRIQAIHTPGHTPGSISFLLEGDRPILFAGDTLFRRSIGRTDLWGGSTEEIFESIRRKLFTLPEDVPVVPGHGPGTTIGEERRLNPFVGE